MLLCLCAGLFGFVDSPQATHIFCSVFSVPSFPLMPLLKSLHRSLPLSTLKCSVLFPTLLRIVTSVRRRQLLAEELACTDCCRLLSSDYLNAMSILYKKALQTFVSILILVKYCKPDTTLCGSLPESLRSNIHRLM